MERYDEPIAGGLSCYDRVVITGTLPGVCYAEGMTGFLHANGVRIFDYPQFAMTLRDRVRDRAGASLAAEAGVTIEHIGKAHIRKEDVVARVLEQRGDRPGLVQHPFGVMEACDAYQPWHRQADAQDLCGGRTVANARAPLFTICRTPGSGWSTCGSLPGRGSVCNSTAMAIDGWRAS